MLAILVRPLFAYCRLTPPQDANGRYEAVISVSPVPGVGRQLTDAWLSFAPVHVWMSRPPANAQFSHEVSLKQTITFSVLMPA